MRIIYEILSIGRGYRHAEPVFANRGASRETIHAVSSRDRRVGLELATGHTFTVHRSTIAIILGDITSSIAEAIVSSDDGYLTRGGGVSRAISRAAGDHLSREISKLVPAQMGEVVVTSAGKLPAKYILHAVTIAPHTWDLPGGAIVRRSTYRAMALLPLLGCRSVAFPAIGAGVAGVSFETVAAEMTAALVSSLFATDESYAVELYLHDRFGKRSPEDLAHLFAGQMNETLGVTVSPSPTGFTFREPAEDDAHSEGIGRTTAPGRQRGIFDMLRHLDMRRDRLETDLFDLLREGATESSRRIEAIRSQLQSIRELRTMYTGELAVHNSTTKVIPRSVFVSSTFSDLKSHRRTVQNVIRDLGLNFVGMEEFIPTGQAPPDFIRQRVVESERYLGVIGMRYGSIDSSSGLSMTELEYRQAVASGKTRHMFVMDESAPITVGMVEPSTDGYMKLLEFRRHVLEKNVCGLFKDEQDLATKVRATLS